MRFSINRADLARTLSVVGRAVPARHVLTSVVNFRFDITKLGTVQITGTNLDMWLTGAVPADLPTADGSFLVNADQFRSFIDRVRTEDVVVEYDGKAVEIRAAKAKLRLPTVPIEEFPTLPAGEVERVGELNAATLARMIQLVTFAAGNTGGRPILDAVAWHGHEEGMTMAGMNGHELAVADAPALNKSFGPLYIHHKTLSIIPRIWDRDAVELSYGGGYVYLEGETYSGKFRQIGTNAQDFPDYRDFLKRARGNLVYMLKAEALQEAGARVGVLSGDLTKRVRLDFSRSTLKLAIHAADTGIVEDEIEVTGKEDGVASGINYQYLADVVSAIPAGDVKLTLGGPRTPLIFEPLDFDVGYTILVAPMAEPGTTK